MLCIVGLIIVLGCVVGGYIGAGGHLEVLFQPFEFIIIFGAAIGSFVVSNPMSIIKGTMKSFGTLLKGSKLKKDSYIELLSMLFATFKLSKSKGDLALESHIDKPEESALFQGYPGFAKDHHAVEFLCDNLRLLTMGTCAPHELEAVMDAELDAHHADNHAISGALQNVSDAMPALGIVAAVLGVIHTMGSITEPPEVLGHLIGGALVGTFSGILMSYGIVAPMAKSVENTHTADGFYMMCIKTALIGHVQGYAPQVSVEFARKILPGAVRPSFADMDAAFQTVQLPS
ncbi:MAG: flagellar motor stator protein MotA [Rhodospirillales bacterium]|nr:flagellar motor stator protein MotA [Rhodospirillales bacterium]